jgi:hypothetical protein
MPLMKRFAFSCLLGLVLAAGDAQAQARVQSSQQQPIPNQNAQATVVRTPANNQKPQNAQHTDKPPTAVTAQPVITQPKPTDANAKPSVAPPKPPNAPSPAPVVVTKPPHASGKPSTVSSTPNAMFTQPQQNFVGGQRELRRFRPDGKFHGGGPHRRNCRANYVVVYVGGAPYWYPFYTAYPYYYEAPPTMVYENTSYVPPVDPGAGGDLVQPSPSYGELGQQWGQDLRREIVTWDEFVDYVRTYIVIAPPEAQAEFREAFIASYGINGTAAYDKAAEQAAQPSAQGPKIINMKSAK